MVCGGRVFLSVEPGPNGMLLTSPGLSTEIVFQVSSFVFLDTLIMERQGSTFCPLLIDLTGSEDSPELNILKSDRSFVLRSTSPALSDPSPQARAVRVGSIFTYSAIGKSTCIFVFVF